MTLAAVLSKICSRSSFVKFVGFVIDSPRPISNHLEPRPIVGLGSVTVILYKVKLRLAQRLTNLETGSKMAVEVLHQGCGRTIFHCPEAGDDTLGASSEE